MTPFRNRTATVEVGGEPASDKRGPVVWLMIQDNSLPEHGSHNRHALIAKYLARMGYRPVVIAASKARCSQEQMIQDSRPLLADESRGYPFVYVRVNDYGDSMKLRLLAVAEYHLRAWRHVGKVAGKYGIPAVILGSSAYPVTPVLARVLARRYKAKSICEVRDLWPLSLEEYGIIKRGGAVSRLMYAIEKRNYEKADAVVFTMEGGKDYISDQKWDTANGGKVDLQKVYHINNGVDLEEFDRNLSINHYEHPALEYDGRAKVVYAGSVRKANDLGFLVDVADEMREDPVDFVVIGDGDQREGLEREASRRGLDNIRFIGRIEKSLIPSALSQSVLLLLLYSMSQSTLSRYGMSQNKLFDYLASGKPILSNLPTSHSIINNNMCGIERRFSSPAECADQIRAALGSDDLIRSWSSNSRKTAENYSFERHAARLAGIIKELTARQSNREGCS